MLVNYFKMNIREAGVIMIVFLSDQLVNYALQQQNPEVNEKSKEIKLKKASLQKQQHELQV